MSAPESMQKLVGSWTGTSRLYRPWLSPQESESGSTASVALEARSEFITIRYTWAADGRPQEGLLLLGSDKDDAAQAVWVDSWHMSEKFMICVGSISNGGMLDILGSYSAPTGPDWGWRIVIEPGEQGSFELVMYNVSPDGEESLAFKNRYERPM
ncbi:MAG TPA: DUF1579 family protein [Blastocatellia bacterium]|jgi:hypothetical protein|nr:DUF1579 family protein [Blastocatellia bacterium]